MNTDRKPEWLQKLEAAGSAMARRLDRASDKELEAARGSTVCARCLGTGRIRLATHSANYGSISGIHHIACTVCGGSGR